MPVIQLTADEQNRARRYAEALRDNKRNWNIKDGKISHRDGLELDIMGITGEMAVHKYYGVPFEFQLYKIRDPYDIILKGYKIDVKTSYNGILKVNPKQLHKPIDVYMNVKIDTEHTECEILGVISKKVFNKNYVDSGNWLIVEHLYISEDIDFFR